MADLLFGRSPAERIEQGNAHLAYLRAAILRCPWAHMHGAPDHPRDCTGSTPCRHEAFLREQADAYLDAVLAEQEGLTRSGGRASDAGTG